MKDATGEPSSVIADEESVGDAYVYIKPGEFFASTECNTWRLVNQSG
ncbi:hypothetical protein [Streptomyces sp. NPDC018055]